MNTELLREYRSIQTIPPQNLRFWVENRLRQMGASVNHEEDDSIIAEQGGGEPGCTTEIRAYVMPQDLGNGEWSHLNGNDASCAMILYALRQTMQQGIDTGTLRVRMQFCEKEEETLEGDALTIGLAGAKEAALGEMLIRCPQEQSILYSQICEAAGAVMRTVRTCSSGAGFRILFGANPNPDLGMFGMRFHLLALENGADFLMELIRVRHSS